MFKIRLLMLALLLGGGLCFAEEQITLTTYYPAPNGRYREIRSQRMAIGDNYYSNAYCWGVGCGTNVIDANADLVVEGRVGIGTVTPISALDVGTGVISARQAYFNSDGAVGNEAMVGIGTNTIPAHPSGIGHGLLSVYDVFLRAANGGAGRWASDGPTLTYHEVTAGGCDTCGNSNNIGQHDFCGLAYVKNNQGGTYEQPFTYRVYISNGSTTPPTWTIQVSGEASYVSNGLVTGAYCLDW